MNDEQIKHLEFIQGIVTRMAHSSFWVKGWCVTLVSAFLALYAETGKERMLVCTIIPILIFWGLDAYFLKQERIFRELYDSARKGELELFVLTPPIESKALRSNKKTIFFNSFFSQTLLMLYVPLIGLIAIVYLLSVNV